MTQIIRFELDDGGSVLVEPAAEPGIVRASATGTAIRNATASYEAALSGVRDAAVATLRQFTNLPHQPNTVTIEFGVRLDVAAGAVIARTGLEGHLQVTLEWKRSEAAEPGNAGPAAGNDPPAQAT